MLHYFIPAKHFVAAWGVITRSFATTPDLWGQTDKMKTKLQHTWLAHCQLDRWVFTPVLHRCVCPTRVFIVTSPFYLIHVVTRTLANLPSRSRPAVVKHLKSLFPNSHVWVPFKGSYDSWSLNERKFFRSTLSSLPGNCF